MNFISRLIGHHKLIVLGFYSFAQRYLTAHQRHVTHILAYVTQACHELIPPDELVPIIKVIANNFATDRSSEEVRDVSAYVIVMVLLELHLHHHPYPVYIESCDGVTGVTPPPSLVPCVH